MTPDLLLEILATVTGILCVYGQTREKIWAWPFGLLSVSILVYIFYQNKLYSDTMLHVVYVVLNIYGWWYWSRKRGNNALSSAVSIRFFTKKDWIIWPATVVAGSIVWGYFMDKNTDASYAYADAFTTAGSLVAQYLLAKKYIHNWIFWIVVDVVAINVYILKGLYVTSGLFAVFLILCIYGYIQWKRNSESGAGVGA